jgi:glycosyltransferase involved in cell wall biosynthesis
MTQVLCFDPTSSDNQSKVRGVGRYLQILKENFTDWIFTNNLQPTNYNLLTTFINPFFNFLQPPLTMKRIAKKQIAVIHDLIPLKYPSHFPVGIKGSINILLNKLALKNYDLIITDSEASKSDIIDLLKIKSEKIKIIYPCLPKKFLINKTTPYSLLPAPHCLYVGDATWNKNIVNLAQAIKIANVTCVFVGKVFDLSTGVETSRIPAAWRRPFESRTPTGKKARQAPSLNNAWQKELNEFYKLTKDDKRFIFPGFVPDSELIKFYEQASFNILPSKDEGFGFSYVESAQFGCPSLLSNIPVLREISDGKAIFFDPNNPQDIAEKIKEIINNKNLRNKIGEDAKKRSEFFSREKFKREFLTLI